MSWFCRFLSEAAERPGGAAVPSSVYFQHCKALPRRISAARLKEQLVEKHPSVCAMFCTKPVQQVLTLTCQHSWTCSSPIQKLCYMQKEQRETQCMQPSLLAGKVSITVQTQQTEIVGKYLQHPPRRNLT